MNEQDKRSETTPLENGHPEPPLAPPPSLRRIQATRELTAQQTRPSPETRAQRERIAALIAALGDQQSDLHHDAVDDLIKIGDPAVPALCEALHARNPWLTSFRAAEALGQIGNGRATGALIEALRHPNGNVRWAAVQALAELGDARALFDLRRVARDDRSRTSWGESVSGAAQAAIDQMRTQNVLLRGTDLIRTAFACVVMLVSLVLAWSVVTNLRADLARIGAVPETAATPLIRSVEATPAPSLPVTVEPNATQATAAPNAEPNATNVLTGTILTTGNVRAAPSRDAGDRIGLVSVGDTVDFLAVSQDGQWYRVKLGDRSGAASQIDSPDGSGWVIRSVVSPPDGNLPVEQTPEATAAPASP